MSMKSLQWRRTTHAARIKLIESSYENTTAKTNGT